MIIWWLYGDYTWFYGDYHGDYMVIIHEYQGDYMVYDGDNTWLYGG